MNPPFARWSETALDTIFLGGQRKLDVESEPPISPFRVRSSGLVCIQRCLNEDDVDNR